MREDRSASLVLNHEILRITVGYTPKAYQPPLSLPASQLSLSTTRAAATGFTEPQASLPSPSPLSASPPPPPASPPSTVLSPSSLSAPESSSKTRGSPSAGLWSARKSGIS